jgi:tetratricopeptide (TPR) repeat protein
MSRLSLCLVGELFTRAGHKPPSANLYDCIVKAASGDSERKVKGLYLLPDEMASYLHTLRTLSNKADHAIERVTFTPADAENALNIFMRVLEWFCCESDFGPRLSSIYTTAPVQPVTLTRARKVWMQTLRKSHLVRILQAVQQYGWRKLLLSLGAVVLVSLALYVVFPYVQVIRANSLLQKAWHEDDIKQAIEAYQAAAENMRGVFWGSQRAVILNRLGRIYAARRFGGYALYLYSEAMKQNPNLAEVYANKAFLLEESGEKEAYLSAKTTKFDEALALYKQALQKDPDDHFTRALQDGVQRRQQAALHRAQVEALLSTPHKCGETKSVEDDWTSTPLTLAFQTAAPRQDTFAQRAGEGEVLLQCLVQKFRESRRVIVQDSAIEDDCFAVRLIAVYRILRSTTDSLHKGVLHVQLLATNTASSQAEAQVEWTNGVLDGVAEKLVGKLLQHLHHTYQLRARIVSVTPQEVVVLNIGADQGVTPGLTMQVLGPDGPAGAIEVTHTEKQQSRARIVDKTVTVGFQKDWKVQEVLKP